jgi:putative peptide zinc metalloprotease protein
MNERMPPREEGGADGEPESTGTGRNLWGDLKREVEQEREPTFDLWQNLRDQMDLAKKKPKRINTVEVAFQQASRGDSYYVLRNPDANTYFKIDPRDHFLWGLMDGEHSVRDLAVAYYAEFGAFAFDRLIRLLAQLKANHFLEEEPADVFGAIKTHFAAKRLIFHLRRFSETFTQKEFSFKNADRFISALYRGVGWLFFTRAAKSIYCALTIAGLVFFVRAFLSGTYPLFMTAGSYGIGLVVLMTLSYVMTFFHEFGHAMACKSYSRKVPKAGFLFYFGSLAWFVDTTDTWMVPKRSRIIVSLAGPFATVILGSLTATIMGAVPSLPLSPVLFQVAFMGYLSALLNMAPVLETDGYYILMDWLEIPMLRKKSLAFLKEGLIARLVKGRTPFTREEKILAVFGGLSAGWSAFLIVFMVYLWQTHFWKMIRSLTSGQDLVSTILGGGILIIAGSPLVFGLLVKILLLANAGLGRLRKPGKRSREAS